MRFASVSAAVGIACGSVPTGFAKFTVFRMLKTSVRNSKFVVPPRLNFFAKHFPTGGHTGLEFRGEVFNLFNTVNFTNPVGTLPQAIPTSALSEANRVQPGQPYSAAAAGTFGRLTSTVGRTVGLGTPRQVQFAVRFSF